MSDIFSEINQELREERGRALWKKYGVYVGAFVVAVVVMVAGRQGYVAYEDGARRDAADAYHVALRSSDVGALGDFAAESGGGYGMLARFAEAGRLAAQGDSGAEALYLGLAEDADLADIYRDAATLLSVMNASPETSIDERLERVEVLASKEGSWQLMAIEMLVGLHLEAGNRAEARAQLESLRFSQNLTAETNQRLLLLESALGE